MVAVPYNQAELHTLAVVEIPAAGIPAVDLLENWKVLVDSRILDNQAEVDMERVDMDLLDKALAAEHSQLVVPLSNQVAEEQRNRMDREMIQREVQVHMGEGQSRWDTRDTWKHTLSVPLDQDSTLCKSKPCHKICYRCRKNKLHLRETLTPI